MGLASYGSLPLSIPWGQLGCQLRNPVLEKSTMVRCMSSSFSETSLFDLHATVYELS